MCHENVTKASSALQFVYTLYIFFAKKVKTHILILKHSDLTWAISITSYWLILAVNYNRRFPKMCLLRINEPLLKTAGAPKKTLRGWQPPPPLRVLISHQYHYAEKMASFPIYSKLLELFSFINFSAGIWEVHCKICRLLVTSPRCHLCCCSKCLAGHDPLAKSRTL